MAQRVLLQPALAALCFAVGVKIMPEMAASALWVSANSYYFNSDIARPMETQAAKPDQLAPILLNPGTTSAHGEGLAFTLYIQVCSGCHHGNRHAGVPAGWANELSSHRSR